MKNQLVEIYRLQDDGTQNIIATCKLVDGAVQCEGEPALVKQLKEKGIMDYAADEPIRLLPIDGIAFLRNLQYAFKSGYLNASDILEK